MNENEFGDVSPEMLSATRESLHSIAEHVLAVELHQSIGKIGLRRTAGGFGQPERLVAGERRRLRVDGVHLVVTTGDHEVWHPLTTVRDASTVAGIEPGQQTGVFAPTTSLNLDRALTPDRAAAAALADWSQLAESGLEEFRRRSRDRDPTMVQWWPEHFDQSFSMSEINFGASNGDEANQQPYWYVGPWQPTPGPFWNRPWGALRSWTEIYNVADAVTFFEEGVAAVRRG